MLSHILDMATRSNLPYDFVISRRKCGKYSREKGALSHQCLHFYINDGQAFLGSAICRAICNNVYLMQLYSLLLHFLLWRSLVLHAVFNGSNNSQSEVRSPYLQVQIHTVNSKASNTDFHCFEVRII